MKLIDKFKQWLDTDPREQIREVQLEVIADEYAIEFTEWCVKNELFYAIQYGRIETKSLLEIYKKEKGL